MIVSQEALLTVVRPQPLGVLIVNLLLTAAPSRSRRACGVIELLHASPNTPAPFVVPT